MKRRFKVVIYTYLVGLLLVSWKFLLNASGPSGGARTFPFEPPVSDIKACIFILAQESDLRSLLNTISQVEERFNDLYHYPYVIVNTYAFTVQFQAAVRNRTRSKVEFGIIPAKHWWLPRIISKRRFQLRLNKSLARVPKGNLVSYHLMCRYYSGFFFRHKLTLKYDYYLRLDPHVDFPCPIREDPFAELVRNNKSYGFVIANNEDLTCIPTLWRTIKKWMAGTGRKLRNSGVTELVTLMNTANESTTLHNDCGLERMQFFNNFELASFALFRDPEYIEFFEYLEESGGFFYERWGDAPVHTFYIMAMIDLSRVHRFKNLGYGHMGEYNLPSDQQTFDMCRSNVIGLEPLNCNKKWDFMAYSNNTLINA